MMSPTRRALLQTIGGTAAATALAPIATLADPLSAPDASERWNTVEALNAEEDTRPSVDWSWDATGYLFIHDDQTNRATQRRIDLKGYVDGSMRIAIGTTDSFDALRVGRGFVAVHLDPVMSNELWRGLFATSDEDVQPTARFERRPWSDAEYLEGQRRIHRMQRYCGIERDLEEPDSGVYRRFHFGLKDAA